MARSLDPTQIFLLQTRENIRAYVRELAGWDAGEARAAHRTAIELIERAKEDPELAASLLAAEPTDLDDLINGGPTEAPVEPSDT